MTDAQVIAALEKHGVEAKRELAAKMKTTERNIYRWQLKPPTNVHVRAALEKALGGKR